MARPLDIDEQHGGSGDSGSQQDWVTLGTARAFAAALSALVIATFVVNRSSAALYADGTANASDISSGTIELSDDDNGRSLFDLADMAPGRPSSECITITYGGTILPVELAMKSDVEGDLGPFLDLVIEAGTSGGFADCSGFQPSAVVYRGTLADLAGRERTPLDRFVNQGEFRTYRLQFTLQDRAEALGRTATVGFVWEVKPS